MSPLRPLRDRDVVSNVARHVPFGLYGRGFSGSERPSNLDVGKDTVGIVYCSPRLSHACSPACHWWNSRTPKKPDVEGIRPTNSVMGTNVESDGGSIYETAVIMRSGHPLCSSAAPSTVHYDRWTMLNNLFL